MSIVKDQNLAPAGRRKINWVRDFMPALGGKGAGLGEHHTFGRGALRVTVGLEE